MNVKLILGLFLLVFGSMSFAVVNAFWVSPTPANNTDYYNSDFTMIMNASSAMDPTGNFIEIDGINHTCALDISNLSCIYTMNYSEKVYDHTYTIKGFANASGMDRQTNETREIPYVGCGQINGNSTLAYDVGSNIYPDEDCFTIVDNDTYIDCAGHSITQNNTTSSTAIIAIDLVNINIENCVFVNGYRAIIFDNVTYSTITNNVFNNQTWDAIAFDFSDESNITYNRFNMDVISHDDIYGFNCVDNCNSINLFYNNMSNGAIGITTNGNDTAIWRNNIYNMWDIGISIQGFPIGNGNTVSDNTISACDVGILSEDMNATVLAYNHMYDNAGSVFISNVQDVNLTYIMNTEEFDSILGNYVNYSVISILDIILPNSAYNLDWSASAAPPLGRISFLGKQIAVSAAPEGVNYNATIIDLIGFTWTVGEAIGYDESQLELWGIDVNGTAVLLNDTSGSHSLSVSNFRMEDYDSIGLYYHGSITPNTSTDPLSQMITILILGIILIIIVVVVPNAMGLTIDSGPILILIGLATMIVLAYNFIIGVI